MFIASALALPINSTSPGLRKVAIPDRFAGRDYYAIGKRK
jgi:hypothetical protein